MALPKASLMKVGFVLDVARKDERFLNDLVRDPFRTLQQSGIDLSPGELMAIVDIVRDTSLSPLAPQVAQHRETWNALLKERRFT
jgi:hypothetical protein